MSYLFKPTEVIFASVTTSKSLGRNSCIRFPKQTFLSLFFQFCLIHLSRWCPFFARDTCFFKTRSVSLNRHVISALRKHSVISPLCYRHLHVISAMRKHSVISPLCYRHSVSMSLPQWGNIPSFPHYVIDIESSCHFRTEGTFRYFRTMLSTFSLHVISALGEHSVISPLCYRHWVSVSFPHWGNIPSFPHYAINIESPCQWWPLINLIQGNRPIETNQLPLTLLHLNLSSVNFPPVSQGRWARSRFLQMYNVRTYFTSPAENQLFESSHA